MAVLENLCPRCGRPAHADPDQPSIPSNGAVMTCSCGFLGIWEDHYWRAPADAERDVLLRHPGVIEDLFAPIVANMRRQADRALLAELIGLTVTAWTGQPAPVGLVTQLAALILGHGFRTDPDGGGFVPTPTE